MSFLEGVGEPVSRCSPEDFGVRKGSFPAGRNSRGRPPLEWEVVSRPGLRTANPPPSTGSFLPLPRLVALVASFPAVPGALEQLCLQTSPGKGGRTLSSGGHTAPASPSGAVPRLGKGCLMEVVLLGASAWTLISL